MLCNIWLTQSNFFFVCFLLETKVEAENSSRLTVLNSEDASVRDLEKMLHLCQRLDPLNGMANCPGYHGYERVWEHINHEDLGFFLFYFSKKDTESLRRPLWSWFMVFNICVCRSWEMSLRGKSLWAGGESSVESLSAHCFCCWMCVFL